MIAPLLTCTDFDLIFPTITAVESITTESRISTSPFTAPAITAVSAKIFPTVTEPEPILTVPAALISPDIFATSAYLL